MEIERSVRNLLEPLWDDAAKQKIPLYLQFEITSRCNLMCKMCYIASNCEENRKRELPASKWLDIARQAREAGLLIVNITGGEPIMKEDFWEIHEGLSNLGVIYTLNTNGTTMTRENVKRLAQSPPFRAIVSIYGGSEDTYSKITTHGKWFNSAKAGVENLLEAGINTVIRMTLVKDNLDDLPKVFEWAESLGQDLYYSDYMSPRREGEDTDPVGTRLDPDQMIQVKETFKRLYRRKEEKQKKDLPNPEKLKTPETEPNAKTDENEKEQNPPKPADPPKPYRFVTENGFICGAGQTNGFVSYDGNLCPCCTANEPFINLLDKPFKAAWDKICKMCICVPTCPECDACEIARYCVPCPPKLIVESGSFCKKSDYLCEYAKKVKAYYDNYSK